MKEDLTTALFQKFDQSFRDSKSKTQKLASLKKILSKKDQELSHVRCSINEAQKVYKVLRREVTTTQEKINDERKRKQRLYLEFDQQIDLYNKGIASTILTCSVNLIEYQSSSTPSIIETIDDEEADASTNQLRRLQTILRDRLTSNEQMISNLKNEIHSIQTISNFNTSSTSSSSSNALHAPFYYSCVPQEKDNKK
mmetsp:Transcript_5810/g.8542  ORF Transcript_5810/g.8542 Transcript_5810/m.8542 type:complete len:197 (+) Transcript_5810:144-734(+)